MKKEDVESYQGKRIKIFLKTTFVYTGLIIELTDSSVKIKDKYDSDVIISLDDISVITEVEE